MNKLLFLLMVCASVLNGCCICSPVNQVIVLENKTGLKLIVTSRHSKVTEKLAPKEKVRIPHGTGDIVIVNAESGDSFKYYIDFTELLSAGPPQEENCLFSSTIYYDLVIRKDWNIYIKTNDEINIDNLKTKQPNGFPKVPQKI